MTRDEIKAIQQENHVPDWTITYMVIPDNKDGLTKIDHDKKEVVLFLPIVPTAFIIKYTCGYIFISEQTGRVNGTYKMTGVNLW